MLGSTSDLHLTIRSASTSIRTKEMGIFIEGLYSLSTIIFSIFLFSCEPSVPTCAITIDQLLNKDGNKVIEVSQGNSNRDFRDKGKDTIEGGYYSFYKNGKIKEYNFLVSTYRSIYEEQSGDSKFHI